MQISRRILLTCAAAVLVPLFLLAADTTSQNTALEKALHQKMNELSGQPASGAATSQPTASAGASAARSASSAQEQRLQNALRQKMNTLQSQPGTAAPQQAMPKSVPAAKVQVTPTGAAPVAQTSSSAENAQTKALQNAVQQKLQELKGQPAGAAQAGWSAPRQPAQISNPTSAPSATAPAATANSAETQRLREAMRKRMAQPQEQPESVSSANTLGGKVSQPVFQPLTKLTVTAPQSQGKQAQLSAAVNNALQKSKAAEAERAKAHRRAGWRSKWTAARRQRHTAAPKPKASAKNSLRFTPLSAPPLPISASKEARLQALLKKYMANQITPEQYHVERAKILGEHY